MKKTILLAAMGATLFTSGLAGAQTAKPDRDADWTRTSVIEKADQRFAKLDTDKDGKITAQEREARKDERTEKMFARLDADKNGSVTLAEMKAAQEKRGEKREARAGKREGRGEGRGEGKRGHGMRHGGRGGHQGDMGARLDANGDGTITREEFRAPALARFDRLDTDKNGIVTKAERDAGRAAWKERRGA